ncbi:RNA-directed DNA polymerase (Reverse transcriptase) [Solwaraspora sp. WMMD1047]|uniref:RNA-directed DNA polymerase (Reverse transcriptase) n=1 Tax=Solwaraspora sp. WMMD1047 TaxID=3016102 RepID=UPI0024180E50|nr:RNA-directed DNA polymerase (Reverse transcriptase) [Solwaraspora sp. WMMD1047]MDG4830007.1 RNA-directed DNA polymerase (Reverse transcriptase) [Solwaraspora sp. WMMD1047]
MPYLLDQPHLVRAARTCMRRGASPGADGLTWGQYRNGMHARLTALADRLRHRVWKPSPLRTVDLTTYTGKTFPAVIPTVEDRIVHRAMRAALEPVLERRMLADWVSGYRPGRNRITAVRQATHHVNAGKRWVADIDVAGASEGGTADQFVDWLAPHVADGSFLALFRTALDGLPTPLAPGSGLWPVLFHLRLAHVDQHLNVPVVRFADNYTAFTPDRDAALTAYRQITDALASTGLRPNTRKSAVRPPHLANPEDLFLIDG